MNLKKLCLAIAFVAASTVGVSHGSIVNFDDLVGGGQLAAGYGGINWGNEWKYYDFSQSPYNPSSGRQRIYNNDINGNVNQDAAFKFYSPSTFQGAFVSGYSFVTVTFKMYLNNVLVATSSGINPSATPTFLSSGYAGLVDEVRVNSVGASVANYYVLDDVQFNSSTIPEPASLATWGLLGLAGLAFQSRRRRV